MKKIELTQGKVALVDDEDFEMLSQYKWHYVKPGYAARSQYCGGGRSSHKVKVTPMHREIMDSPDGKMIDHKNHDGLDNRKSNLRICTRTENRRNSVRHKNNKSGYKGVWQEGKKFRSAIWIKDEKRNRNLGTFETAIQAAKAYNKHAKAVFGEFAFLNKTGEV